ncbi:unnamed protein product, partial [Meganyctiphanes norvegica]
MNHVDVEGVMNHGDQLEQKLQGSYELTNITVFGIQKEFLKGGETPLYVASQQNRTEIVKFLLDNNADVNKANNEGQTPLFVACYRDHSDSDVVQLLVDNNADVNKASNSGETPLQWGSRKNAL